MLLSVLLKKSTQECHCPISKLQLAKSLPSSQYFLQLCAFLTIGHTLRSPLVTQSVKQEKYFLLYLRAWSNLSDFLLSFPQEKSPFFKMHAFTILFLLKTIFLPASKTPHLLAVLDLHQCLLHFYLSYFHVSAA